MRFLMCSITVIALAAGVEVLGHERGGKDEPRVWNPSFVYGATAFGESEAHQTLGLTFRVRLTERLSLEPEFRYSSLPSSSFESSPYRRQWNHSDSLVAVNLVYDFRDEARRRFVPYLSVGAGWGRTASDSAFTELPVGGAVPVFPAPTAPISGSSRTTDDWLWLGAGVGLRIALSHGFFVSPEFRLGGTNSSELAASAVVKLGYGF